MAEEQGGQCAVHVVVVMRDTVVLRMVLGAAIGAWGCSSRPGRPGVVVVGGRRQRCGPCPPWGVQTQRIAIVEARGRVLMSPDERVVGARLACWRYLGTTVEGEHD